MRMRIGTGSLVTLLLATGLSARTRPDQVLVLYNADWTEDLPGTEPGQDSEEVARYYVRRHTDARTGRKPHLLGLTCRHKGATSHLNSERLPEASTDNYFGVVYRGRNPLTPEELRQQKYPLPSDRIECRLPADDLDPKSVLLVARRVGQISAARTLYSGARPVKDFPGVQIRAGTPSGPGPQRSTLIIRADAKKAGIDGDLVVHLSARDRAGNALLDETVRVFDPAGFVSSRTGPDGRRDDQHYLDDIEGPVKAFLEDPTNAEDGRLLKDHILYIVICHGLPRVVSRVYGIAQTAVPTSRRDSGNLVSLCQRLEMAYYDIASVRPLRLSRIPLNEEAGHFQCWTLVSTYWYPFIGRQWQPYMHPAAYKDFARGPEYRPPWKPHPHFTTELRRSFGGRFLYVCSRVGGHGPDSAREQIDAAAYAQRYLTPRIGRLPVGAWDGAKALAATEGLCGADELKALGLPGSGAGRHSAAHFGRRASGGYLPGAIDWFVISGNGCSNPTSQVNRMLRDGVAVTAGAARAYRGCAHTTSFGWWDARPFYHLLFRGYELGEARLAATHGCQWVTSFFGDPLYCPDLRKTAFDTTPPNVAGREDIRVTVGPARTDHYAELRASLVTTPDNPEMVLTTVEYWPQGDGKARRTSTDPWYRAGGRGILRHLAPETTYVYRLRLTDPYGNVFDSRKRFGELTFRTPKPLEPPESTRVEALAKAWIGGRTRVDRVNDEQGEIDLVYEAGTAANAYLVRCGELKLHQSNGKVVTFYAAGGHCGAEYRFTPGRTYRIRLQYRQYPTTREVWLIAKNGRRFLLAADNRLPGRRTRPETTIAFAQSAAAGFVREAVMRGRSDVGSEVGSRVNVKFDAEAFDRADGR